MWWLTDPMREVPWGVRNITGGHRQKSALNRCMTEHTGRRSASNVRACATHKPDPAPLQIPRGHRDPDNVYAPSTRPTRHVCRFSVQEGEEASVRGYLQ